MGEIAKKTGVHWHENVNSDGTVWIVHDVDISISEPVSVEVADMDGDGTTDIVCTTTGDKNNIKPSCNICTLRMRSPSNH